MKISTLIQIAKAISQESKDTKAKVGAVALSSTHRILGTGYNGYPPGYDDTDLTNKHEKVIHAEMNALINSRVVPGDVDTMVIYGLCPCADCMKMMAAYGVKTVYYQVDTSIRSAHEWLEQFCLTKDLHPIKFVNIHSLDSTE